MSDFGDGGGAPCGVDCVPVLAARDFGRSDGVLPVVDESAAGAHEDAHEAGGHVEISESSILLTDEGGHGEGGLRW